MVETEKQHYTTIQDRVLFDGSLVVVLLGEPHQLPETACVWFDGLDFVKKLLL